MWRTPPDLGTWITQQSQREHGHDRASTDRYLSYRAALDREQAAAHDLQRLWELARSGHDALTPAASHTENELSSSIDVSAWRLGALIARHDPDAGTSN